MLPEQIAQSQHLGHANPGLRDRAGLAESRGQQCTLSASTASAFVASAVDQRFERKSSPYIQGADAFGRIDLVAGDGQQVDAKFIDRSCDLADRLRRIRMQGNAVLARDRGDV